MGYIGVQIILNRIALSKNNYTILLKLLLIHQGSHAARGHFASLAVQNFGTDLGRVFVGIDALDGKHRFVVGVHKHGPQERKRLT